MAWNRGGGGGGGVGMQRGLGNQINRPIFFQRKQNNFEETSHFFILFILQIVLFELSSWRKKVKIIHSITEP